jgi:hypothetical protein
MTPPATTPCATCRAPVIETGRGDLLLEAETHRLGIYHPNGEPMTRGEVMRLWGKGEPAGRRRHICQRPKQGELFAIPDGTDKRTRGRR